MDIKHYIEETELSLAAIADAMGVSLKQVRKVWDTYPAAFRKTRKQLCYRTSKLGTNNPMLGKCGEAHPGFVGQVGDGKGYLLELKPDWYTGRRGSKHVFVHQLVVVRHFGLTEMPRGWVVHHCDENKHNNSFDNLVLMTVADHRRLHTMLGATTISKESTLKWVEAHGTSFKA